MSDSVFLHIYPDGSLFMANQDAFSPTTVATLLGVYRMNSDCAAQKVLTLSGIVGSNLSSSGTAANRTTVSSAFKRLAPLYASAGPQWFLGEQFGRLRPTYSFATHIEGNHDDQRRSVLKTGAALVWCDSHDHIVRRDRCGNLVLRERAKD